MSRPVFSTFTHSVGAHTAGHSLPSKLRAIAQAGYTAVEIFQDDLDSFMDSDEFQAVYKCQTPPDSPSHTHAGLVLSPGKNAEHGEGMARGSAVAKPPLDESKSAWNAHGACTPSQVTKEIFCASYVGGLCNTLGLQVLTLQPMRDVEGWTSPRDRLAAFKRVQSRFPVMRALGTDLMIVCSNNQAAPATTGDVDTLANDLRELADAAAQYEESVSASTSTAPAVSPSQSKRPIRIAYEALSWGAHVDKWSQAWAVVKRVNRANVGICFDSFNTLGREFADPCSVTGIQEPETLTRTALRQSLDDIASVPADKIFFLQVGDARKLAEPLKASPSEEEPRPARMIWSRSNRLFPGEEQQGAFMPVTDFVKAVTLRAGYKGPWSIEVFNSSLHDEGTAVQDEHARRGFQGLSWLVKQVYPQSP